MASSFLFGFLFHVSEEERHFCEPGDLICGYVYLCKCCGSGCLSGIRNFPSRIQGQKGIGSRIRIRNKEFKPNSYHQAHGNMIRDVYCGSLTGNPGIHPRSRDQRAPDPGSAALVCDACVISCSAARRDNTGKWWAGQVYHESRVQAPARIYGQVPYTSGIISMILALLNTFPVPSVFYIRYDLFRFRILPEINSTESQYDFSSLS